MGGVAFDLGARKVALYFDAPVAGLSNPTAKTDLSGVLARRPARNHCFGSENLDNLIALVAGFGAQGDDATVRLRARGRNLYHLCDNRELVARACRTWPGDFDAETDHAASKGHTFDKQACGSGGGVPTAGCEPSKYRVRGGRFLILMEGLGVKFSRELFYAGQIHHWMLGVAESLSNRQVFEVEGSRHGRS